MIRRTLLALAVVATGTAQAHEVRPGFLELRERAPGSYDLLWKRPTGGEVEIRIAPVVPDGCTLSSPDRQQLTPGAVLVRGTLTCEGGIAGRSLRVAGLETTVTDVLVRIHHADGRLESHLLRPAIPSVTLGARTTGLQRSWSYAQLGVQHILLGVDHLLFVLGLLLIVSDRWMLVKTITSFTVAHSLTLAIATLGYASAPLPPLNAAIALSILFLGPEIVRVWRGETSFTIRHPWVVAFAFGLLHGFGFASGLSAMGLPKAEIPLALLLFNVGVEIGQVAFVALVLLLERSFRALEIRWARWVEALPGYAVGSLGAYWTIQRVAALLTVLFVTSPAWAHAQQGQAAGFASGVGHPLSGLDHVLAMIAVGLWGAQLGAPAIWLLPVTFPMVMAIGGFLGLVGLPIPGVEVGIALSAVSLGAMVAREARPRLGIAAALVAFFAIFHGHAHGTELPPGQSGLLYSVGFVIATGCLHAIGIGIGLVHRWRWGRTALRVAGAAVALAGVFFLWRALAS
ncbi:MAG TPA: HupE/UreJ family protein [Candidatus Polarisedimenticolaceae bacterium]